MHSVVSPNYVDGIGAAMAAQSRWSGMRWDLDYRCVGKEEGAGTNEIGEDRRWLGSWPAIGLEMAVMKSLKRLP